jgi:hypothetical protein
MRTLVLIFVAVCIFAVDCTAQVSVIREGHENPVLTVAKSTLWGGLAGLVLGGAIALVAEDNEADIVKWSFVAGTFGGFAFGVYHVATRERPTSALFEVDGSGLALRVPTVTLRPIEDETVPSIHATATLFSCTF